MVARASLPARRAVARDAASACGCSTGRSAAPSMVHSLCWLARGNGGRPKRLGPRIGSLGALGRWAHWVGGRIGSVGALGPRWGRLGGSNRAGRRVCKTALDALGRGSLHSVVTWRQDPISQQRGKQASLCGSFGQRRQREPSDCAVLSTHLTVLHVTSSCRHRAQSRRALPQ